MMVFWTVFHMSVVVPNTPMSKNTARPPSTLDITAVAPVSMGTSGGALPARAGHESTSLLEPSTMPGSHESYQATTSSR